MATEWEIVHLLLRILRRFQPHTRLLDTIGSGICCFLTCFFCEGSGRAKCERKVPRIVCAPKATVWLSLGSSSFTQELWRGSCKTFDLVRSPYVTSQRSSDNSQYQSKYQCECHGCRNDEVRSEYLERKKYDPSKKTFAEGMLKTCEVGCRERLFKLTSSLNFKLLGDALKRAKRRFNYHFATACCCRKQALSQNRAHPKVMNTNRRRMQIYPFVVLAHFQS